MSNEHALFFEAPALAVLDRIASDPAPAEVPCGPPEIELFREVYFDTPGGELERRGVTVSLRFRADGRSTLAVEARDPAGQAAPMRAAADLPGSSPREAFEGDSEAARLLRAAVDPARLGPRLELETTRRTRTVELDGAEPGGATLACDTITVRSGRAAADLFRVVLRAPVAAATEAEEMARGLAADYGLRPAAEELPERARRILAREGVPAAPDGGPCTVLQPSPGSGGRTVSAMLPATELRNGRGAEPGPGGELPPGSLLNMELSSLAFNRRVLVLAEDPRTPLLERVRFVSIFSANLDEFFRVRIAGFKHQVAAGSTKRTLDGATPVAQLEAMRSRGFELADRAYDLLRDRLLPELAEHGIHVLEIDALTADEHAFLRGYYRDKVHPLLQPLAAGPGHAFPHIRNLRPALAVVVRDPHDGELRLSVLALPGELPRLVPIPGGDRMVPLEAVVRAHLREVYPGVELVHACLFRVTRSAELHVPKGEVVGDLLRAVEEELAKRPYRPVVRLEVERGTAPAVRDLLLRELRFEARDAPVGLEDDDVYQVDGLIDLRGLHEVAGLPFPELKYPPFRGRDPLRGAESVIGTLRERDVLVHFPYDSFEGTVERFLLEASEDPEVVSIRLALYRTNRSSRIVEALRRASERGKEVVALVELTARFDEQRNVEWARYLQASGIRVAYGIPGQKIHAKVALVVRREGTEMRQTAYIGTGNLNASTASSYTDLGLLTADPELAADVAHLFALLTGEREEHRFRKLLVAPFNLRERFLELIAREADHARYGRGGHLRVKINGLADRTMIAALYEASRAGVRVELIVRGICSLRPGVPGYSENVRVVSKLGRFLEHARIFRFANAGQPEYYIGSADWRTRNLATRVEVVAPVADPGHRAELDRVLDEQLADPDAWELGSDGSYYRRPARAPHAARERE
ncbi:MAG TPA: polyphosphate kinase 1 [Longimicrobiaceae bacterium]|nr:polyphosphate kinase 1 [Longimicrobiaceae bacterium]